MKNVAASRAAAALLFAALAAAATPALAATAKVGSLDITAAWARATPPGARVAGVYLTIHNGGSDDDRLVSTSSPAGAAAQLHEMKMAGGVMSMRPLPDGVDIPAGQTVTFSPTGIHIMLLKPTEPLREGATLPLHVTFAKAGAGDVTVDIGGLGAKGPAEAKMPADMSSMKAAP